LINLTNKFKIIVAAVLISVTIAGVYYCLNNDDKSIKNPVKLSYDLYVGSEINGHSTVTISEIKDSGYELNITTIHDTGKTIKSTYSAHTNQEFAPLSVLYKDNSTAPMLPERVLDVKFKDNSALIYTKYIETTADGLSKSYSIVERNETVKIKKDTYAQMIVRFLKIRDIDLEENYMEQFALVNQNMTIEVAGKETVKTPAGSFECWKIREILYKPDKTEHSTVWHSIDRDIPVKIKNEDTGVYQVLTNYQGF